MYTENLFQKALIDPVNAGANKLFIVSGYATSAMAFHHLQYLKNFNKSINIELFIGMCPQDGLSLSNHSGFIKIIEEEYSNNFTCSYVVNAPAVHSKVYAWYKDEEPFIGFAGSANYTQSAFINKQREILVECDAKQAYNYFQNLSSDTIYCTHAESENFVQLYKDKFYVRRSEATELAETDIIDQASFKDNINGLPSVTVSLLAKGGSVAQRSGLNWGQRPEYHREPNQAYIRLTADIYHSNFFPQVTLHFTILTDDGKVLICTRAQQNGKAIHTPHNNSLIGEYFRNRLGVANGAPVTENDLIRYGRTNLTFYKIDDETYFMDFSPQ